MAEKPEIKQVLQENARRSEALNQPYDPILGKGSPLKRKPLRLDKNMVVHLPLSMWYENSMVVEIDRAGGIEQAAKRLDEEPGVIKKALTIFRMAHDFEFWCASCVKIESKKGETISFILNPAQRKSLKDLEDMRTSGEPVRDIELKYRQYGSTTMKNAYVCWVQNVVHQGYNAYVCSLDRDGATEIVSRYDTISEHYPNEIGRFSLKSYRGARNTLDVVGTGGKLNIGSAERPNAPSGRTVQCVLISEAGKMKSTVATGADKLITNMMSMVPLEENTFVMIESTAEIAGAWFRNEVFRSMNGESGFKLTFINWITDPALQMEIEDKKDFVSKMGKYDWFLWKNGASLEQIRWYQVKEKEYQNSWQMKQEWPTTIQEAFQSTGRRKIAPNYVENLRRDVCDPLYIGDLVADAEKGPDSLKNIRFEENPKGNLLIWSLPGQPEGDHPVGNRYGSAADIGGTTEKADWSVLSLFDRYWMMEGGLPERACTWRGHVDQDLFAWKAAQISKWYHNALLAVEMNSLKKEGQEGAPSLTILDEIKEHYFYLYARNASQDQEKLDEGKPLKFGFHMNHATKTMIINRLIAAARDGEYIERDIRACNEMDYFEVKEDGSLGAVDGMHDDILDTTALGIWLCLNYMDPPFYENISEYQQRKTYTEAML